MALSRAFTTRRLRLSNELADSPSVPRRTSSTSKGPVARPKISAPIQLIHTTNMLSYNAPDLPRASRSSSKSDEDSDAPTAAESTPPTSPDVGPGESSPSPPEPNHLTSYFKNPGKTLAAAEAAPPAIPKRSPSHTKKNSFDAIARSRSRSVSRTSRDSDLSMSARGPRSSSGSPSSSTRASPASSLHSQKQTASPSTPATPAASSRQQHSPPPPPLQQRRRPSKDSHPFGHELAQVTELAEEYSVVGSRLATVDEEQLYIDSRGLVKLSADDYLGAVQGISAAFFPEASRTAPPVPLWI